MRRLHIKVRDNWYRDLWLLTISVVVLLSIKALHNQTVEIQVGRKQATAINCGLGSGVVTGGVDFIKLSSAQRLPLELERFLEAHGYQPLRVRISASASSASAYAKSINAAITRAAPDAHGLVVTDGPNVGHLNCALLGRLTKAPPH